MYATGCTFKAGGYAGKGFELSLVDNFDREAMEQVKKFRNALILGASRELDAFSRAMRQELTDSKFAFMTL